MAVSYGFCQAIKQRRRQWRRVEVGLFFCLMAWGLSYAGCSLTWRNVGLMMGPYVILMMQIFRVWGWQRMLPVSSLDDWAVLEYGVEFEKLAEGQQKEILRRYRVGTYFLNDYPDEFEAAREAGAHLQAYAVMKVLLPSILIVYWMGWKWLPVGRLRAGWTDGPVVMMWVMLLVLGLSRMIRMWTEPDDVGEPRVVKIQGREA